MTGASAGIGAAYAECLAARGFDLVLAARRTDRLEALAETLRNKFGVAVRAATADLADADQLEAFAAEIGADDTVTLLVNNAGTSTLAPVADTSVAAAQAMTDLNIRALVRLTMAVLPGMKDRDRGAIVNIGSVLGFRSLPVSTIYSATKAYVMLFTRGLIDELAGTNVSVQLVAPAATATDLWDISGVPLSALDPAIVMTVEAMVDAALAGLDAGETITMPSVEEADRLIADFDASTLALLGASQKSAPASRYLNVTA
ncbi:NAD(P)-dependent oxidoreductase [Sphingobium amiense]|uniref:NAD(P)-dependent oxidoreductase n=1 Tax=Sphingobium amiense TaxID=135719 RepID=A0A494W9C2_9SPHN|nr:NAD(P)-dependent oxidoreductase [Sphingobium amiense]